MKKPYKTGLVLSGGGTRGFAHLGIIAALYENNIYPDIISGTSAGAIVGAFIAGGKKPEEIHRILKNGGLFKYTKLHFPVDGLLKLDGLKEVIETEIPYKNIEDLPVPLFVTVSNLNSGNVEYRNKGLLSQTVLASSSIPILFSPVAINDNLYVDGGLLDNVPLEPIKNDCEFIIASNISPVNHKNEIRNLIQIASRAFYMSVNMNKKEVMEHAKIYVEPEGIDEFDILSRSHADELFELGYKSAMEAIKKQRW